MTSLQDFANAVTEALKAFELDRDMGALLVFYEAKQTAYNRLVAALPQVKEIRDFWRYVQNMPSVAWLPVIEHEIQRITYRKHLCGDCGAVAVMWPERRCIQCKKARRLETYQKAKQRARLKQRLRKCRICKVEPLNPRQRVCASCQANARHERNQRYQKSLKERKLRRIQPDFTREGMSTLGQNHMSMQPPANCGQRRRLIDRSRRMNSSSRTVVTTDKFMPIKANHSFSVPFTTQYRESPENGQGISRQEYAPQRGGRVSFERVSALNNSPKGFPFRARQGMEDTCQRSSRPPTSALLAGSTCAGSA